MNNKLLKAENKTNNVVWYFTNLSKAAVALGIQQNLLTYYINRNKECKGWYFEWIDGSDIKYKYINPSIL